MTDAAQATVLRVLGCSGGIGGTGAGRARTSSFLIDDDILLDAGTGVEDLDVPQLARIDHVFLSHAHLDHICALPFMVDSIGGLRQSPVTVHALPQTIDALMRHIFNWEIWPDFTQIPDATRPFLRFEPLAPGQSVVLGARVIRPIAAIHTVPAVGYHIEGPTGSLVYSGDTFPDAQFWATVNAIDDLRLLLIENAFSNAEHELAERARHLYPAQLARGLQQLRGRPRILITHLKPSDQPLIEAEISAAAQPWNPHILAAGQSHRF